VLSCFSVALNLRVVFEVWLLGVVVIFWCAILWLGFVPPALVVLLDSVEWLRRLIFELLSSWLLWVGALVVCFQFLFVIGFFCLVCCVS